MYISFCIYTHHAGFVCEVPKDSEKDFDKNTSRKTFACDIFFININVLKNGFSYTVHIQPTQSNGCQHAQGALKVSGDGRDKSSIGWLHRKILRGDKLLKVVVNISKAYALIFMNREHSQNFQNLILFFFFCIFL